MKRILTLIGLVGITSLAFALSTYTKVFYTTYNIKPDSKLAKANCAVCHATAKGGKLNPYGTDLSAALKAANTKKLSAEILHKVDNLDSNKDGVKNGDSIKADKNPGL